MLVSLSLAFSFWKLLTGSDNDVRDHMSHLTTDPLVHLLTPILRVLPHRVYDKNLGQLVSSPSSYSFSGSPTWLTYDILFLSISSNIPPFHNITLLALFASLATLWLHLTTLRITLRQTRQPKTPPTHQRVKLTLTKNTKTTLKNPLNQDIRTFHWQYSIRP